MNRLNKYIKGISLGEKDVVNLMALCTLETIVLNGNGLSPICTLFEPGDWPGCEYSSDVDEYYDTG